MEKIKSLEGKSVAIVGLGKSWHDFNLARSHGAKFDEIWAINAVSYTHLTLPTNREV